jgi:hypothetical protein
MHTKRPQVVGDGLSTETDNALPPTQTNGGGTPINVGHMVQETAAAKPTPPKVIEAPSDDTVINPFDDLDALRNAQDYDEFLSSEGSSAFNVRTLKESMHLRVNPNEAYTLNNQYVVATKQGAFFVPLQFRDALGPLPRRCNLHIAVDGHGEYFLLLIKQPNPGKDDNKWYQTARMVAAAASSEWVKVTKPTGIEGGWGFIPIRHKMFEPKWPERPFADLLKSAFPDRIVNRLSHDLIQKYKESGAW